MAAAAAAAMTAAAAAGAGGGGGGKPGCDACRVYMRLLATSSDQTGNKINAQTLRR